MKLPSLPCQTQLSLSPPFPVSFFLEKFMDPNMTVYSKKGFKEWLKWMNSAIFSLNLVTMRAWLLSLKFFCRTCLRVKYSVNEMRCKFAIDIHVLVVLFRFCVIWNACIFKNLYITHVNLKWEIAINILRKFVLGR